MKNNWDKLIELLSKPASLVVIAGLLGGGAGGSVFERLNFSDSEAAINAHENFQAQLDELKKKVKELKVVELDDDQGNW